MKLTQEIGDSCVEAVVHGILSAASPPRTPVDGVFQERQLVTGMVKLAPEIVVAR